MSDADRTQRPPRAPPLQPFIDVEKSRLAAHRFIPHPTGIESDHV
jgi:hypothetical protein